MSFDENASNFCKEEKATSKVNFHHQSLTSPSSSFSFYGGYGFCGVSDGDIIADFNRDVYLLWYIDIPNKLMYRNYRNAPIENRKLLHIWPHWCLLTAIKNTDFYLFKEVIEDIMDDILEEGIFHSTYVNPINYINPILEYTYFDVVSRNGLMQFVKFLLSTGAKFNQINKTHHNRFIHLAEGEHIDTLAVFLQQEEGNLEKYQLNLNISLHIAVRRNDLICAYMLLIKGARADISDNDDITALHLATIKNNIDMIQLILMASQHSPEIDNYRDYYKRTTRDMLENLPRLSLDANFFKNLQIPPIKEQTLKFFLINCDEIKCLKVMNEGFRGQLSHDVAEELLNIATRRNYCKIVHDILGKFSKNLISLNVVKNTAILCGNHAVLRELVKLQPEITNDLIMNACRLLKISLRDIDNTSDRLKCLKLILGQENVDVRYTDGFSKRKKNGFEDSNVTMSSKDDPTFYKKKVNTNKTINMKTHRYSLRTSWSSFSSLLDEIDSRQLGFQFGRHNNWDTDENLMLHGIPQCKKISSDETVIKRTLQDEAYDNLKDSCFKGYKLIIEDSSLNLWIPCSADDRFKDRVCQTYENIELNRLEQCYEEGITDEYVDELAFLLQQPTINPNFERALNNALYIAVRRNDQICAYMLLCKGANASDPTIDNMTALHLAAFNDNVDMVRLILMASQQPPDIDSYRDEDNRTTREVIDNLAGLSLDSNFFEDIHIPPIKEKTLKFFLNNSDETKCLKVMKEGFHGELCLSVAEELLNLAMQRNYYQIMQEILKRLNKSTIYLNEIKDTAVLSGNFIILRELLKLQSEVTNDMITNACRCLKIPSQEIDNTSDRLKCLKLILEHENADVWCTDGLGNTPLHYALNASCYEAVTLLLNQGSYLGFVNESNNIVIADIPGFVLCSYFNDCVQLKKEWTDECTIEFDYRCLMPHDNFKEQQKTYEGTREMEVILYVANNDRLKYLLKHPLISSFVYIKWYRIRYVLYANFVFYIMFYFSLNTYVFSMNYDRLPSKSEKQITDIDSLQNSYQVISLWILVMSMLLLFIFREILQFMSCGRRYFIDLENWTQVLLIVLILALLCGFPVGIMVILLSTWKLMILISHHLYPSTCIEMFQTVFLNFIHFLFPYLFFILAFAMTFHMLFKKDYFSNFRLSLFKIIIMFTGEFDANEIPFFMYPVWSRIVFILFVFYVVLILFNLLNGLAINNIAEILNKAEIIGLIFRIRLIAYFERMIVGKPLWNFQCWWNPFNFLSNMILVFPHYLKNEKMTLKPYQNMIVYEKRWSTLKMDPDIIKHAKKIVNDKYGSFNDDIMDEFVKLQTKLTQMKVILKCNVAENISQN